MTSSLTSLFLGTRTYTLSSRAVPWLDAIYSYIVRAHFLRQSGCEVLNTAFRLIISSGGQNGLPGQPGKVNCPMSMSGDINGLLHTQGSCRRGSRIAPLAIFCVLGYYRNILIKLFKQMSFLDHSALGTTAVIRSPLIL